jgi:flagellar biosynthesis protein FlhG
VILLKALDKFNNQAMNNYSGLLIFYFSFYKLIQNENFFQTLNDFIPVKNSEKSKTIKRDRRKQIYYLIEKNNFYHNKFLSLIKKLFPVIIKQLNAVISAFGFKNIYFSKDKNAIYSEAYLKLLSNFLHNILNSGLGIIVGFKNRPASDSFYQGADKLLDELKH